jgi:ribosomal protein S12 methylthiotransferase accessory factor
MIVEEFPADVRNSLRNKAIFCPMIFGASKIKTGKEKSKLVTRNSSGELEIFAPTALLNKVYEFCDGTRTLEEILNAETNLELRDELANFIDYLAGAGVIIDGNHVCAEALKYAHQFNPTGITAPPSISGKIARRFSVNSKSSNGQEAVGIPLEKYFQERVTRYTFGEMPVSEEKLLALSWSLAGILNTHHPRIREILPHRTNASAGGMHLVEVYLALLVQVGRYQPGIYRVSYPDEGSVELVHINGKIEDLPLVFGKPWELTFATGAFLLAADNTIAALRYRNRSVQYLFMEAGAILQNGALSAYSLDFGYATIGGFYEDAASKLFELHSKMVLGTAIFGPLATEEQESLAANAADIDFAWVNTSSPVFSTRFHLARARVKAASGDRPFTWGRSLDPKDAALKAIAEAIEREGFREPRNVIVSKMDDLSFAVDPDKFFGYTSSQYSQRNFPYSVFRRSDICPWAAGIDLVAQKPVFVLAELVFSRQSLQLHGYSGERAYTQTTSSGCAAGLTVEDATIRALLEVVERHAFMSHWLTQTPGKVIPSEFFCASTLQRIDAIKRAGCKVCIQLLATDFAYVVLAAAQNTEAGFTTMGTAANFDILTGLEAALDELDARVYAWLNGHVPSITSPRAVRTTEHHFELYGTKKYFGMADAVLFPDNYDVIKTVSEKYDFDSHEKFIAHLAKLGDNPIIVDITPKRHCIDQGRTKVHVVKAFIPGLLPMSFGYYLEPLGMIKSYHQRAKFPHPFP